MAGQAVGEQQDRRHISYGLSFDDEPERDVVLAGKGNGYRVYAWELYQTRGSLFCKHQQCINFHRLLSELIPLGHGYLQFRNALQNLNPLRSSHAR